MDDLLKAFQAEISQDLDACAAALGQLRRSPADAAAVADLHRRLCSIREMSTVLGQRELSEAASRGAAALEAAPGGEPAVPTVEACLAEIRAALHTLRPVDEAAPPGSIRREAGPEAPPIAKATIEIADSPSPPPRMRGATANDGEVALDSRFRGNDNSGVARESEEAPAREGRRRAGKRRWYRPRNVLLAGGSTVFGLATAMAVLLLSVDPNDYRDMFESTLQSATGRDVTIGRIAFAVSLNPTIVLENVTLANAEWGSRPRMVAAERVEVQLALLPLARGELRGRRFVLHGADILLETNAHGRGNWQLAGDSVGATPAGGSPVTTLPQLARLTIEDSTLSYRNGATGETETFRLARVAARPGGDASLLDMDVDSIVNGQRVRFAGSVGGLELLQGAAPYPVDIAGDVAGLAVTLRGEVAQLLQGRGYSLAFAANGEALDGLGSMLAIDLPPGRPVEMAALLEDDEGAIRIQNIAARIGRSDASGAVTLRPGEPNWRIDADLAGNQIDLDDFVPAEDGAAANDPRLFPGTPLPYRWMGKIDMTGRLTAGRVVSGDTSMTGAALEGAIAAGRLTLDRLRFGYAGGEVVLKATGDVNAPAPLWTLQGSGRDLAGGDTLAQLFGLTMVSGGKADLEVAVTASGGSLRDIATSLHGDAGMSVTNGHINDDLMRLFLTDLTQAASLRGGSAQLRCMTAIYSFTNGNGRARTFVADTGAAVVSGTGAVNLRSETISMTFEPAAKDVSLAALAVPVHVTGPLGDPNVTPDPVRATANIAGSAAGLATGGLAGAVLGLVGADVALDTAPIASCAALPGSFVAAPQQDGAGAQQPAAATAQPAATQTQPATAATSPTATQTQPAAAAAQPATVDPSPTKTKKASKARSKSPTDRILDGASEVVDGVGDALGNAFKGSSSNRSKKPQGSKRDK